MVLQKTIFQFTETEEVVQHSKEETGNPILNCIGTVRPHGPHYI